MPGMPIDLDTCPTTINTLLTCSPNSTENIASTASSRIDLIKNVFDFGTTAVNASSATSGHTAAYSQIPNLICSIGEVESVCKNIIKNPLEEIITQKVCYQSSAPTLFDKVSKEITRVASTVITSLDLARKSILENLPDMKTFSQSFTVLSLRFTGAYCLYKVTDKAIKSFANPKEHLPGLIGYAAVSIASFQASSWFNSLS